jgi:CDP-diacylglycerol--glycerol-3-phosphate 3-phosphatidyltransferase
MTDGFAERKSFWNLPNAITLARVVAVPIVVALLLDDNERDSWIAGWIFIAAIIGDFVDGWLARKMNLQTKLGAFLDPLADKLLVGSTLIALIPLGRVEVWLVVLLEAREMTITALRAVAANDGVVIAASKWGKYKTAFQGTALSLLCLHYPVNGIDMHRVGYATLLIATLFSLWSGWDYMYGWIRATGATQVEGRGGDKA